MTKISHNYTKKVTDNVALMEDYLMMQEIDGDGRRLEYRKRKIENDSGLATRRYQMYLIG